MASGDLPNKLEAAAKALMAANPIGNLTPLAGQSSETQLMPAVILKAERGEEFPQGSGNFNMELTIQVESQADDIPLETHRGFFAWVVDLFTDSAIAANLSALAAEFHVLGVLNPKFAEDVQERAFSSELTLTAYCCASDL